MRLRDSTIIAADASVVWPYVADPILQSVWNPKIVAVERGDEGPVRQGETFTMIYRMSGRDRQTTVDVTIADPPCRVALRHRTADAGREQFVVESYDLSPHPAGVKVVQTVDLTRAGIPWPARLLIWFIHQFGKPTGEPYMEGLKKLVEQAGI